MHKVRFSFFLSLCVYAFSYITQIQLNGNSSLYSDVQSLSHNRQTRNVMVQLSPQRKCTNPIFEVRLFGSSLFTLSLHKLGHSDALVYHYFPIVDNGTYAIEIVALYCGSLELTNYQHKCLESVDGGANVINLPYTFSVETADVHEWRPRWVFQPWTPPLLFTHYQDRACGDAKSCGAQSGAALQISHYEYLDGPSPAKALDKVIALLNTTQAITINVCNVGTTHSKRLSQPTHIINFDLETNVRFIFIESQRPSDFNVSTAEDLYCSYVIFGYENVFRGPNASFYEDFTTEMRTLLKRVTKPAYAGPVQFFLRSVYPSGLSAQVTSCPPTDYLNPAVTSLLNAALHAEATQFGVDFVDTAHIFAPLWNTAVEWVYHGARAYTAASRHTLLKLFEATLRRHQAPRIDPGLARIPNNTPVRFHDEKNVYLYRDTKLHAFPNGATFIKMGFDFDQVVVLMPDMRRYAEKCMGDGLPSL